MGLLCANGKDSWSSYRDDARVGLRAVCKLTKFLGRSPDTAIVEVRGAHLPVRNRGCVPIAPEVAVVLDCGCSRHPEAQTNSPVYPGQALCCVMRRQPVTQLSVGRPILAAWIAAAALWLAACQPAEPVLVGFIGGLSGTVADLGVNGRNGAELAIEALNAQGGTRYELRVEDDLQDPDRARAAVASLDKQRVRFIVGPMTSATAMAIVSEVNRLGIVLISPTATTNELTGKVDHFFRVAPDARAGARQIAELLRKRGLKSMAVLMDFKNRAYSESFGHAAAAHFRELGGQVGAELSYESRPSLDFAALARQLTEGHPQVVLIVSSSGDASLAAQHLRRIDPTIALAVSPWAANAQFLQMGGRAVEGALALQALDLESGAPAYVAFRRRYRERFGEDPTTAAVQTFDAVTMGVEALKRQGKNRSLRDTLGEAGASWPGLHSAIVLDAYGDTDRPMNMTEVRGGRFQAIAE